MEIKNVEVQDEAGNIYYPHTDSSVVKAIDTSGLGGIAGKSIDTQTLLDELADKVANRLLDKGLIANNLATDNTEMVLAAPMGKELKRQLDEQNKNIHDRFPSTGISFDTNIKDTSNHLLYSINNENWCGLGCTPDGSFTVRVGTWNEGKHIFKICSNGAFTFDDQDIITNSDLTWNFVAGNELYTVNSAIVQDAYTNAKYSKGLNLCILNQDWYIKSGIFIGYEQIRIATLNGKYKPSNDLYTATTLEGQRVYINIKSATGEVLINANAEFALSENHTLRDVVIYNLP